MDFWRSIHRACGKSGAPGRPLMIGMLTAGAHAQQTFICIHTLQLYTLLALRFGQPEVLGNHGLKPDETSDQLGSGHIAI